MTNIQGFFLNDHLDEEQDELIQWIDEKAVGAKGTLVNARELIMGRWLYSGVKVTVGIQTSSIEIKTPLILSCTGSAILKVKNIKESAKIINREAADVKLTDRFICFFKAPRGYSQISGEIIFIKKTLVENRQVKLISGPANGVVVNHILVQPISAAEFKAFEKLDKQEKRNGRSKKAVGDPEELGTGDTEED